MVTEALTSPTISGYASRTNDTASPVFFVSSAHASPATGHSSTAGVLFVPFGGTGVGGKARNGGVNTTKKNAS